MTSSRANAPKHGPGHLLVDGSDTTLHRKAKLGFKPTMRQEQSLLDLLEISCEVYNAASTERWEAWRRTGAAVRLFDQFKQVTHLHGVRDDVFRWGTQPIRGALRRVDTAYSQFYRRARSGENPRPPRRTPPDHFNTISWDEPIGWRVKAEARVLQIQGVGAIRLSTGSARQIQRLLDRGGVPVTLSVTRGRSGCGWSWRACIGFKDVEGKRHRPKRGERSVVGADRGVIVTLALSDGHLLCMPTFLADAQVEISALLRRRSGKSVGSRSWEQLNHQLARAYRRAAQRADNWARLTAAELVGRYDVIVLEDLTLKNMSRSGRRTPSPPGRGISAKKGLNRRLHQAALGRLRYWICIKAEESGRRVWVVNAAHTSQTCSTCGYHAAENRSTRDVFRCVRCGCENHADVNAAQNIAMRGRECEAIWHQNGSPLLRRPGAALR